LSAVRGARAACAAVAVAIALAGCTAARDSPTVDARSLAAPTSAVPSPIPSASTSSSRALQELARFDAVNRRTVRADGDPDGRQFIDALVAAGYRKADMQVTEDRTTIGLAVPSVQFSVLTHGVCLVGQHGTATGRYRGAVLEPVAGRCLIGKTRAIDW
jgi:hypothetical protein